MSGKKTGELRLVEIGQDLQTRRWYCIAAAPDPTGNEQQVLIPMKAGESEIARQHGKVGCPLPRNRAAVEPRWTI